jgi:acyl dehydratase
MSYATAVRHKRGGMYFEDFEVGEIVEHRYRRTVTQMDNMLFSNMTLNPQPLHIDRHFCEQETQWGQPLINSLFTLGLMIGMSVSDLSVLRIRSCRIARPRRGALLPSSSRRLLPARNAREF